MSMADPVVLMQGGQVEQDATPAALYARPASVFAAGFIGTPPMSLLPLASGPDGAVVAGTQGPAVAPAEAAGTILGLRPEEVTLTDGPGLSGRVVAAEFLGAETTLSCAVGIAGAQLQARIAGHHLFEPDAPVRLLLPPALHLFDAASGRRLPDAVRGRTAIPA
jgi:sn-glycerol 3-phosphate transport system ATP-binding protein